VLGYSAVSLVRFILEVSMKVATSEDAAQAHDGWRHWSWLQAPAHRTDDQVVALNLWLASVAQLARTLPTALGMGRAGRCTRGVGAVALC